MRPAYFLAPQLSFSVFSIATRQVVLEVKGEEQLRNVAAKLEQAGVRHKLWVEQPEDFPTCVATAPYPKSVVAPLLKKLKLCKWG